MFAVVEGTVSLLTSKSVLIVSFCIYLISLWKAISIQKVLHGNMEETISYFEIVFQFLILLRTCSVLPIKPDTF